MTPITAFWLLAAVLVVEIIGIAIYARHLGRHSVDSVLRAELAELADALEVQRRTVRRLSARVGMRDTRAGRREDGGAGDLEPPASPPDPVRDQATWLNWAASEAARRIRNGAAIETTGPGPRWTRPANAGRAGAWQLDIVPREQEEAPPKKRRGRPPKEAKHIEEARKAFNGYKPQEEAGQAGQG